MLPAVPAMASSPNDSITVFQASTLSRHARLPASKAESSPQHSGVIPDSASANGASQRSPPGPIFVPDASGPPRAIQGARPSPSLLSSGPSRELARLPLLSSGRPGSSPVSLSSLFRAIQGARPSPSPLFRTSRELARLPLFSLPNRLGSSPVSLSSLFRTVQGARPSPSLLFRTSREAPGFSCLRLHPASASRLGLGLSSRCPCWPPASASRLGLGPSSRCPHRPRPPTSASRVGLLTSRKLSTWHKKTNSSSHDFLHPWPPFLSPPYSSSKQQTNTILSLSHPPPVGAEASLRGRMGEKGGASNSNQG